MSPQKKAEALITGQIILHLRRQRHMTQSHFAKAAQVSQAMVSRVEQGLASFSPDEMRLVHLMLRVSEQRMTYLFGESVLKLGHAAMAVLKWPSEDLSWASISDVGGQRGLDALIHFSVAAVMFLEEKKKTRP